MQMRKIYNLEQERGIHIQRKKTHYFIVNLQIITLAASPSGYSGPCYSGKQSFSDDTDILYIKHHHHDSY